MNNKKISIITIPALMLLISSAVQADVPGTLIQTSDGQVNFVGKILSSACKVSSGGDNTILVNLGSWPSSKFDKIGSRSLSKPFSISLTNCPKDSNISISFTGQPVSSNSTNEPLLALTNTSTSSDDDSGTSNSNAASGLGVLITEGDTPIKIGNSSLGSDVTAQTSKDGTAVFNFTAQYYSYLQKVTAGEADATTEFTITYS